jgi:hypothetical protein
MGEELRRIDREEFVATVPKHVGLTSSLLNRTIRHAHTECALGSDKPAASRSHDFDGQTITAPMQDDVATASGSSLFFTKGSATTEALRPHRFHGQTLMARVQDELAKCSASDVPLFLTKPTATTTAFDPLLGTSTLPPITPGGSC